MANIAFYIKIALIIGIIAYIIYLYLDKNQKLKQKTQQLINTPTVEKIKEQAKKLPTDQKKIISMFITILTYGFLAFMLIKILLLLIKKF